MPLAYDSVVDGIRVGIRSARGGARAQYDITESTYFWPTSDPDQSSLAFDSLDFLELVVCLEEQFGWYVPDDQLDTNECQTVGDLALLVLKICTESDGSHDV